MEAEPITTLIVDDEREAREGILDLLRADPDIRIVGDARTGREAVAAIEEHEPELVFLDVQMPQLDGFGVLAELRSIPTPVIVFVTAYDAYALQAFEAHALDYLLKPFSDERFAEAVANAKARVRDRRTGQFGRELASILQQGGLRPQPSPAGVDRIVVRAGENTAIVRVDDIDWIEARNYCAKLHVRGREYLVRETMARLTERLDPGKFVRIHRSSIVNLDRLESLEPYFHGSHIVRLRDGTRLLLSRSRRPALEHALGHTIR